MLAKLSSESSLETGKASEVLPKFVENSLFLSVWVFIVESFSISVLSLILLSFIFESEFNIVEE